MGEGLYIKRKSRGLTWLVREGMEDLVEVDFARDGVLDKTKENMVRTSGFFVKGKEKFFVKVFKEGGLGDVLKSMVLGHKAKKEFLASRYLTKCGVNTAKVVAVGVGSFPSTKAVIISEAISDFVTLEKLFSDIRPEDKDRYLGLLAEFTSVLHRASFQHRDYHLGNLLLVRDSGKNGEIFVIDLHRTSFPRKMTNRRGLLNMANIVYYLKPYIDEKDIYKFLSQYKEKNPDSRWDIDRVGSLIERRVGRMERRRFSSRTKRCYKKSSEFSYIKSKDQNIYFLREIEGRLDEILGLVKDFSRGGGRVIKDGKKSKVVLFDTKRGELIIKGYENLSLRNRIEAKVRKSRGHAFWWAARGISVRGFDTPKPLALIMKKRLFVPKEIYVVTESISPSLELDRFIAKNFSKGDNRDKKTLLISDLAFIIGGLYNRGVYHGDLKASNIAVREERGAYKFSFLDLDNVRFMKRISKRRMAKNLSQLFVTIPLLFDAFDRRDFLHTYLEVSGCGAEKKTITDMVYKMVSKKNIHYFISDGRDVYEDAGNLKKELFGVDH